MNRLTETGVLAQCNFGKERYRVFEAVGVLDLFTYLERSLASRPAELAEHGTIHVPRTTAYQGAKQRSWMDSRRQRYRLGTLSPEQVTALEACWMVVESQCRRCGRVTSQIRPSGAAKCSEPTFGGF